MRYLHIIVDLIKANLKMEQIPETKNCPLCGKEIMAVAKKCRHCGKWIDSQHISPITRENISPRLKQRAIYGLMTIVGIVIAIICGPRYLYSTNSLWIISDLVGWLMISYGACKFIISISKNPTSAKYWITISAILVMLLSLSISVFHLNDLVDMDCGLECFLVLHPLAITFSITVLILLLSYKSSSISNPQNSNQ